MVAEELDADFGSIRVVNAANGAIPGGDVYANPDAGGIFQITGASNSTKGAWGRYRLAARPGARKADRRRGAGVASASGRSPEGLPFSHDGPVG